MSPKKAIKVTPEGILLAVKEKKGRADPRGKRADHGGKRDDHQGKRADPRGDEVPRKDLERSDVSKMWIDFVGVNTKFKSSI